MKTKFFLVLAIATVGFVARIIACNTTMAPPCAPEQLALPSNGCRADDCPDDESCIGTDGHAAPGSGQRDCDDSTLKVGAHCVHQKCTPSGSPLGCTGPWSEASPDTNCTAYEAALSGDACP
jgi:hypothetical protein